MPPLLVLYISHRGRESDENLIILAYIKNKGYKSVGFWGRGRKDLCLFL